MSGKHVSVEEVKAGAYPRWSEAGKVHDWRNHVPDEIRSMWSTFTPSQINELVDWAQDLASKEEWD
ncbi:hypothetical protein ADL19_14700 [Streptomyces purpurogeneiscleroticus]|nr:hypothetical protein ADL19_14700 [Streptomyces purpurogeneiscleroticus]